MTEYVAPERDTAKVSESAAIFGLRLRSDSDAYKEKDAGWPAGIDQIDPCAAGAQTRYNRLEIRLDESFSMLRQQAREQYLDLKAGQEVARRQFEEFLILFQRRDRENTGYLSEIYHRLDKLEADRQGS